MNKNLKVFLVVIIIALLAWVIIAGKSGKKDEPEVVVAPEEQKTESIVGCYVATLGKDVYTLKVDSQAGDTFKGRLSFKNFEKDSSSGTYEGTYKDGILLGNYSFTSEGMDSVVETIFKKSGNSFVRGFGEMNATGDRFADTSKITYDPNQTFILSSTCTL